MLILPCEGSYTTHPAAPAMKTNFYKYQNNRYSEEERYFEVTTVTIACILGFCMDQCGSFGQRIMDKKESLICLSNHIWLLCLFTGWMYWLQWGQKARETHQRLVLRQWWSKGWLGVWIIKRFETYHQSYICCADTCTLYLWMASLLLIDPYWKKGNRKWPISVCETLEQNSISSISHDRSNIHPSFFVSFLQTFIFAWAITTITM